MVESLSILIPAFNEQDNIEKAIESVLYAVQGLVKDFEIVVIDDGSTDQTKKLVIEKAQKNPAIRLVSYPHNQGYGIAFRRGMEAATKMCLTTFPGDNDMSRESLRDIIKAGGQADLILSYMLANQKRSLSRRMISKSFVLVSNTLFGLKLRYYNGAFLCRTDLLQRIPIKSTGMTLHAECIVRLIKAGCSYKEIAFEHTGRMAHASKALKLKHCWSVVRAMGVLFKDIHWLSKRGNNSGAGNKSNKLDISVIVPAFNEEGNIKDAINSVLGALEGITEDYEIIVIDDGSRDQTLKFAQECAESNQRVRVFTNGTNKGYGIVFQWGVALATKTYFTLFPGDNDLAASSLHNAMKQIGQAEIITSYPVANHRRSLFRKTVSKTYVLLINGLFGLDLRYYNGPFVYKTSVLRNIPIRSTGLGVLSECLIKLLKKGYSYKAIPFEHVGRKSDKSKAFSLKGIVSVVQTLCILIKDLRDQKINGKTVYVDRSFDSSSIK